MPTARPRLCDLFCGAGGAALGYYRAGFNVTGIDNGSQPRYPFRFILADALSFLDSGEGDGFDVFHASPPCQAYSDLRTLSPYDYPDLIPAVRHRLDALGKPYIIENVEGAPLISPVLLCGTMFPGLRVLRHRLFESNFPLTVPPEHPKHPLVYTMDRRKYHYGMLDEWEDFVSVNGGGNCTVAAARDAMGISWMQKAEINQAIPPDYAEFLGKQYPI